MSFAGVPLLGFRADQVNLLPVHKLGTYVALTDGTELVYVKAQTDVSQGDIVEFNPANGTVLTISGTGFAWGVAQNDIDQDYHGWVTTRGLVLAKCSGSSPLDYMLDKTSGGNMVEGAGSATTPTRGRQFSSILGGQASVQLY